MKGFNRINVEYRISSKGRQPSLFDEGGDWAKKGWELLIQLKVGVTYGFRPQVKKMQKKI